MRYDLCTQRNGEAPRHDSEINRLLLATTVQTFSSCTSRLDICQCLVVESPMDNMPNKPITQGEPRNLEDIPFLQMAQMGPLVAKAP